MPNLLHTRPGVSYQSVSAATSGSNVVVSAVTNARIRVLGYNLSFADVVKAQWRSGSNVITGQKHGTSNTHFIAPFSPIGHFETYSGQLLNLELTDGKLVSGEITYSLVYG